MSSLGSISNRVNTQITSKTVFVIDEQGTRLGIFLTTDAIKKAQGEGKDLIELVSNATPPVCKIMEIGKFQYEQNKSKKVQKNPEMKEFRFGISIDPHDLQIKANQIAKLLQKGHPIRVTVRFYGRELARKERGIELINNLRTHLPEVHMDAITEEASTMYTTLRKK